MHSITTSNEKGGTGKTTVTHCLVTGLARRGFRVLAVDCDHISLLSKWLDPDGSSRARVADLFVPQRAGGVEPFDLSANISLVSGDKSLASVEKSAEIDDLFRLRDFMDRVSGRFDFTFFDCHPGVGVLAMNALVASKGVLIPSWLDPMSLEGTNEFLSTLETVRRRLNPDLKIIGLIANHCDPSNERFVPRTEREMAIGMSDTFGAHLFKARIPRSVRARDAYMKRVSVFDIDPNGKLAISLDSVIDELCQRLGVDSRRPPQQHQEVEHAA